MPSTKLLYKGIAYQDPKSDTQSSIKLNSFKQKNIGDSLYDPLADIGVKETAPYGVRF